MHNAARVSLSALASEDNNLQYKRLQNKGRKKRERGRATRKVENKYMLTGGSPSVYNKSMALHERGASTVYFVQEYHTAEEHEAGQEREKRID